jgi:hypothetical protein
MSRAQVFDLGNKQVGEFAANISRGWGLGGVGDGGMMTTITLPDTVAAQDWLDFGRIMLVEDSRMPAWPGFIDTPWDCFLPVKLSVYNVEYALAQRSPEQTRKITGSLDQIFQAFLDEANRQEDLYFRLGIVDASTQSREETMDQRSVWEQMTALARRVGCEILIRPERNSENRLIIYVDALTSAGVKTGFLLQQGYNMQVTSARLDRAMYNRITGISSQGTAQSRLKTEPQIEESSLKYRTRSKTMQFQNVVEAGTLLANTQAALARDAWPWLVINIQVQDVGDAFQNMRPGNRLLVNAPKLHLPRGIVGFDGTMRVLRMVYDEPADVITATLETKWTQ